MLKRNLENMATIIDLSKTIEYKKEDPWFMRIKVINKTHKKSGNIIKMFLKLPKRLFPSGWNGWADDKIKNMGVHSSTHIDAPWHFSETVNGEKAKSIDEVPLDWLYGDGVVLNMSHKKDFEAITIADIKNELKRINVELKEGMIVLIRTDRDKLTGNDYVERGTGMSAEATLWLIKQGIKVMGIDQWGFDLPLKYMAKKAKENNDKEFFWEAHLIGREHEYLHMEQLTNLAALPVKGFKVAVFPLKIKGASAGPARVVGIID